MAVRLRRDGMVTDCSVGENPWKASSSMTAYWFESAAFHGTDTDAYVNGYSVWPWQAGTTDSVRE